MKKYYIKLKPGESSLLLDLIISHLHMDAEEAETLINYGSIWNNSTNQRLKDPASIITAETIVINKPDFPVTAYPFHKEDILYEDPYFFMVFKHPFFPTVPTPYSDINSLVYGMNQYLLSDNRKEKALVINRLDLSARGLVLLAKDKKYEGSFHALFKNRKIRKYYLVKTEKFANVQKRYTIEDTLEWNGKIRPAKTNVFLFKTTDRYYYFLTIPRTGRTHQIRKHFAWYIHPIYGEPVYSTYSRDADLGLICFAYIFKHPVTGRKVIIKYLPKGFIE